MSMRRLLKQALIAVLFAVTVVSGGHNIDLQHDLAGGHVHLASTGGAVATGHHAHGYVTLASHEEHSPAAPAHEHSGEHCALAHAHCCALAILTSDQVLMTAQSTLPRLPGAAVIPYGQQPYPPHRPPRAAA